MEQVDPPRPALPLRQTSRSGWGAISISFAVIAIILLLLVLRDKLQGVEVSPPLMVAVAAAFCTVMFLGTRYLIRALGEHRAGDELFQQMANNIGEIFWTIDAETKRALYVNEAYETITGSSCRSLLENPSSYEDLIHPEDRTHVLAKLEEATRTGRFDERFRIVCTHGEVRWVKAHGFPVRDASGKIRRLVGTVQEITAQKQAEDQTARNLATAESALAEADALRKATLALTQDLRMDFVMGALLRSLGELIPYTCARVLVPEDGLHLLALGERQCPESTNASARYPLTLSAEKSPFLQRILADQKSVLISDTNQEEGWRTFKGHRDLRSWLSVPLVASDQYMGFLSVGHTDPNRFTQEHLRRAELLAIPAAAGILNARLYQRADIFGSELERRLADLQQAETALEQSEKGRRISEEKFQKVFRSSPIAFSISTLGEGRYVEVNGAFEQRYGYSRVELIGHTADELRIWEDPAERTRLMDQLRHGRPARNCITRFRTKSGNLIVTVFSADTIEFDGQSCLLAVSEDVLEYEKQKLN